MKYTVGRFCRFALIAFVIGGMSLLSQAAWNGAGVVGGTGGTNINDTANWVGGTIDDNFSTITEDADLVLTADYTSVTGLNFTQDTSVFRHITVSGTNTIFLRGHVPGHDVNAQWASILFPSNTMSYVKFEAGLTLSITNSPRSPSFCGNGIFICDAKIEGPAEYLNQYSRGHQPHSILRNNNSTFTGRANGDAGRIYFTTIADKGEPSSLGAGTEGVFLNNFDICFIGSRDQYTDRTFGLMNGTAEVINNSACGSLNLTGTLYTTWNFAGVNIEGISAGESVFTDGLDDTTAGGLTKLVKKHSGTWRFKGNNTFTGYTNETYDIWLYGGTLIGDCADDITGAGSNRAFRAGRRVRFEDSNLQIIGKSGAGNTTYQEFGYMAVANTSANVLTADGNGGDGTTVVVDDSFYLGNGYGLMLFDCIGEGHIFATDALPSSSGSLRNINGVLLGGNGERALLLMKDKNGRAGFVTQDGSNEFLIHTNTLALTAGNASAADHVSIASDLTRTADLNFATLDIDASANAVILDMDGNLYQNDGSAKGRGVAVNGNYPVTVRGGSHGACSYAYIYNYGTEKLSWELTNNVCIFTTAGPGLIDFTQSLPSDLNIGGGTTRISAEGSYTSGTIRMFGDGVFELGADLNGSGAGDFSRWVGTGGNNIYFYAGGGFSAYGADRTVNLSGQSPSRSYTWITPEGFPLILSSPYADSTLVFENPLNMYSFPREVRVHDGLAAIDARMTGKISGYGTAGLVKSGEGTLELTGEQSYYGDVSVIAGGLRLGADNVFSNDASRLILRDAVLDAGSYANSFDTLELLTDSTLEMGDGSASLSFDDSSDTLWTGTLTINGSLGATTLRFGTDSSGLTTDQLDSIAIQGAWAKIDEDGYIYPALKGTLIILR